MTNEPAMTSYSHTQKAPLCLLAYAIAFTQLWLGCFFFEAPPTLRWIFSVIGFLTLFLAASIHHLTVSHLGDKLSIRFGPIPLFRRKVKYADIVKVEVGRTLLLDGLGIHYSMRGGWVWNIWGRDCVVVHMNQGTLRIGTDDAENLAAFLAQRIES